MPGLIGSSSISQLLRRFTRDHISATELCKPRRLLRQGGVKLSDAAAEFVKLIANEEKVLDRSLIVASIKGQWKDAKKTLEGQKELAVTCVSATGKTPLHWFAHYGNLEATRELVENYYAGTNVTSGQDNKTPLHYALLANINKKVEVCKLLLEKGPKAINKVGNRSLPYRTFTNDLSTVTQSLALSWTHLLT